ISVPVEVTTSGGDIGQCFSGVPGLTIMKCDGTDLFASLDTVEEATRHCCDGKGPVLLQATATRPYSHSLSDDQVYYRTREELDDEKNRDCNLRIENYLIESGIATEERLAELKLEWQAEVRAAAEAALVSPKPVPSDAMKFLYSEAP